MCASNHQLKQQPKTSIHTKEKLTPRLGVNIDHVATLRQARGVGYPDPIQAALVCEQAGADGITLHLREDRRHIQDSDVYRMAKCLNIPMNLEMAATSEMVKIACSVSPEWVCLVPEKREELTTEGGLDVDSQRVWLTEVINKLQVAGSQVSLFIDPEPRQIQASIDCGADAIELHTGRYAEAVLQNVADMDSSECLDIQSLLETSTLLATEYQRIKDAVNFAHTKKTSLLVNAGHGLTRDNVYPISSITGIHELNIGHALIADAVFLGLMGAVGAMKEAMCGR
ncbi:pyridoxine 5'-phosphate synthase [Psychrobacter sp. I-STPA6b]|uniref:pyridoxine 5'-phosphate synthase n=1 Tax=Psychrobacter sp. I-STPA6b TaxID=2585718 RepID=UPI001D0CABE3|nr:pyridoxine 5'-phosphate synthase [Psychrobacter sp. I-STPA6b]